MRLRDTDPVTLALVKMGLTLDQRDGVLLTDEAPEEVFAFFSEIAPEHHLYVQVDNRWDVNIDVGVFRRPREHMRRMIRAQYPGYRICSDPLGLAGSVDGYVEELDPDELAAYHEASNAYLTRDLAINDEHGIEF
jgi:hypothetical protein